jgi:hypothetical protein
MGSAQLFGTRTCAPAPEPKRRVERCPCTAFGALRRLCLHPDLCRYVEAALCEDCTEEFRRRGWFVVTVVHED